MTEEKLGVNPACQLCRLLLAGMLRLELAVGTHAG